jgi:hypothetical protein
MLICRSISQRKSFDLINSRMTADPRDNKGHRLLPLDFVVDWNDGGLANLHMPATGFTERAMRLLEKTRFVGKMDENTSS